MIKSKKLYFIFVLFLLLSIFSFYFFYSPRYSLYQIQQSIKNKDKEAFLKYVDLDMLIEDFVQQIIRHESKQEKSRESIGQFKILSKKRNLRKYKTCIKRYFKTNAFRLF